MGHFTVYKLYRVDIVILPQALYLFDATVYCPCRIPLQKTVLYQTLHTTINNNNQIVFHFLCQNIEYWNRFDDMDVSKPKVFP